MKEGYLYAVDTDLGEFWLSFTPGQKLYRLDVIPPEPDSCCVPGYASTSVTPPDIAAQAIKEVVQFASGDRTCFTLPYILIGGTAFQQSVWNAAAAIPYGQRCTYTDLACRLGNEKKRRAAGRALGENPLLLVIPCHRVVPSGGGIGGYRGGRRLKKLLLDMEERHSHQIP